MEDISRVFMTWEQLTAWLYTVLPTDQAQSIIDTAEQEPTVYNRWLEFDYNDIHYTARVIRPLF
jgi:hypothetical protein